MCDNLHHNKITGDLSKIFISVFFFLFYLTNPPWRDIITFDISCSHLSTSPLERRRPAPPFGEKISKEGSSDGCQSNVRTARWADAQAEEENAAWNTEFWSHTFHEWDEIVAPSSLSDGMGFGWTRKTAFAGISIDYDRFLSDSLLENYKMGGSSPFT